MIENFEASAGFLHIPYNQLVYLQLILLNTCGKLMAEIPFQKTLFQFLI